MSSRGNFLGTGPASGVYTPKPTPQKAEEMPIYINDELLDLGGRLNNILEGGAFPPQSQMPKRVKEPMMIYFTQVILPSITSPGVWLYRKGKWWKIIDDPSAITQNLTVYKKFPKGSTRPPKPPINKFQVEDLNGWKYVPESNDDANDQWMSVATFASTDPDNPKVEWSEPIMFNTEGTAGQPGADGYSIEFRYIASTNKPSIKNNLALEPETTDGEPYTQNIPNVSHPNKNFIWMIQTYIRDGSLGKPWSDPVKFSTPNTTKTASAYAIAAEGFPTHNPNAAGLPGPDWVSTVPNNIPDGWNLWRTDRLEWTDGTQQSSWSTPYKANGTVGSKSESRYIASTETPDIKDKKNRNPVTSGGLSYTLELPNTSHPNKNFIWIITGVVNRLNQMEIEWSNPAKYATPDTTNTSVCFAIGSLTSYPSFTNTNPQLPGSDWSKTFPGALQKGEYIWESQRIEWSDGTAQTLWTNPIRTVGYDGTDGISFEQRFRASTALPSISVSDREPSGWSLDVPKVTHPNNSFIWVVTAKVDSSNKLVGTWSKPSKYATPDSTQLAYAYGIGTDDRAPTHNPSASGLPGSSWNYNPPKANRGQRVWVTDRYQWNNSTPVTNWSPPSLFSGADGDNGNHGNDGLTPVSVYKNSTNKPKNIPDDERKFPPDGWTIEQVTPPMGQSTWASRNFVRGAVETATTVTQNYSASSMISGFPGEDGNNGNDGANGEDGKTYYTWIMYADTETGGGINPSPIGMKYVGFAYNKETSTPSLNSFDYAWYKLEGTQGIPGQPGEDGVTTYTWIKYADDAQGTNISENPDGKKFLGLAHNKTEQTESMDPKDYKWSKIGGDQGIPGTPGEDGVTLYTWVKYADDAQGTNMSESPDGKPYVGFAYNKLDIQESNDPKDYKWSLIKGQDGLDGIPGAPGVPGQTFYTWIKYADNNTGGGMSDYPEGKDWMGLVSNKTTPNESDDYRQYNWSKVKGDQGIPGVGEDGITYYTWVKYARDANGTGITDNPTGMGYLGLAYNKVNDQESTDPKDYAWSKIKGEEGQPGVPGLPGADGKTYYTWIKYADNAAGDNMSDNPSGKDYLGLAHNKETDAESPNPKDYTWSKMHGDQGIPGKPGLDGKTYYTWVKYADDDQGTNMSDDPAGKGYLGLAYNKEGSTESGDYRQYAWSKIHGDQGIQGPTGTDGTTYYTWLKYADTPTSGMSDDPAGKNYLGLAHNQVIQQESTNYSDYTWSKIKGENGIPGIPGTDGTNGVTYYTWIKYADDNAGSGMDDLPDNKIWMGLATNKTTQAESDDYRDYVWSKIKGDQGVPGQAGSNGITYYTWVKYADTPTSGMSDDPTGKLYLGLAYNKTIQQESTIYSDYSWSLIKGQDGTDGNPGINGNDGKPGTPGAGFFRLSMTGFTAWPSQETVDSAFRSAFGRDSELADVLTIYDSVTTTKAETRSKSSTGAWVAAELLVHGDMILRGTIISDKIAAGAITTEKLAALSVDASKITAGAITSDKIVANVSLNAPQITGVNISGGRIGIGPGEPFRVENGGSLYATSAEITGKITATNSSFEGTISGSHIQAGSSITLGDDKFKVLSDGTMSCKGAKIGGTLESVDGTFTGSLSAVSGTFTGTVQAGRIDGGEILGSQITVPRTGTPKFSVTEAGDMTCHNANIQGSLIQQGGIEGSEIHIPSKSNWKFKVDTAGNLTANDGTFRGTIFADKVNGGITSGKAMDSYKISVPAFDVSSSYQQDFTFVSFIYRRKADSTGNIPSMTLSMYNLPFISWQIYPTGNLIEQNLKVSVVTSYSGDIGSGSEEFTVLDTKFTSSPTTAKLIETALPGMDFLVKSLSGRDIDSTRFDMKIRISVTTNSSQNAKHEIVLSRAHPTVIAFPNDNAFEQL